MTTLPPLAYSLHLACKGASHWLTGHNATNITIKDRRDARTITSDADTLAEASLIRLLSSNLDCRILSEEAGLVGEEKSEYLAIVDPLDGSLNYLKDAWGLYAVSIGLVRDNEFVAGAIYLPFFQKALLAQKGQLAFLADAEKTTRIFLPLHKARTLDRSRICIGRGSGPPEALTYPPLSTLTVGCIEAVNYASCSVGLASVALGKIDALVLPAQAIWDFAAGYCILKELGCSFGVWKDGWQTSVDESALAQASSSAHFDIIAATNASLFKQIVEVMI